jgi:hypothetical protein
MKKITALICTLTCFSAGAQLYVGNNAEWYLQKGSNVFVQCNVEGFSDINGEGSLVLSDTSLQYVNMHGFSVSNLVIDNTKNVSLSGNILIKSSLRLLNGLFNCEDYQLQLDEHASISNQNDLYINTRGAGQIRKDITSDLSSYTIPLGNGSVYAPVILTTYGPYKNAWVEVSVKSSVNPNKPQTVHDYIGTYWTMNKNGIEGTLQVTARYQGNTVSGNEKELSGYLWNGKKWTSASMPVDLTGKQIKTVIDQDNAELFAMNFSLKESRLFPNPVRNAATLEIFNSHMQMGVLKVTDARGRTIYQKSISLIPGPNQYAVPTTGLKNGIYNVQVLTAGQNKTFNLIKL